MRGGGGLLVVLAAGEGQAEGDGAHAGGEAEGHCFLVCLVFGFKEW